MQLSGIPVLFVPGNAGSYKQGKLKVKHPVRRTIYHGFSEVARLKHNDVLDENCDPVINSYHATLLKRA